MAWEDQYFGLGIESVWGTQATIAEWHGVFGAETNVALVHETLQSGLITSGRDVTTDELIRSYGQGGVGTRLLYKGAKQLYKFLWSDDSNPSTSGSGTGADPYVHVYTLGSVGSGWTAEQHYGFPDASLGSMYALGAKCQTFQISAVDGEECKINWTFNAKDAVQGAKSTQTLTDYDTYGVSICQILCEVDDATAPVTGVTINVDHKITSRSRLDGSCNLTEQQADEGKREITGVLTAEWDDKTLHDLFRNRTAFKLELIATGAEFGGGPATYKHVFLLDNCQFLSDPLSIGDGAIATRGMTFRSRADATHSPLKLTWTTDDA